MWLKNKNNHWLDQEAKCVDLKKKNKEGSSGPLEQQQLEADTNRRCSYLASKEKQAAWGNASFPWLAVRQQQKEEEEKKRKKRKLQDESEVTNQTHTSTQERNKTKGVVHGRSGPTRLHVNQAANHMMPRSADETIICQIIKRSDIADNIESVRAAEGQREPSG